MLRSPNPDDHPMIIPNYFKDNEDFKSMLEGIKLAKIAGKALVKYNTTYYDETYPNCKEFDKGISIIHTFSLVCLLPL